MEYRYSSVREVKKKKGKVWVARIFPYEGKKRGKEKSKVLPEAKGKKEAIQMAHEWVAELNAAIALAPTSTNDNTIYETIDEYLRFQRDNGEIELSTYNTQNLCLEKQIKPYIGDYSFLSLDRTIITVWLTKLNARGYSQNTIAKSYQLCNKVYNYYYFFFWFH